jgi:DNA repair photolyase
MSERGIKRMALNKSKGNMYPFIDFTWNPIRGTCPYECVYCYVSRMRKRFKKEQKPLYIDDKETEANLGGYKTIFICSTCDIFHPDIPDIWIRYIGQKAFDYDLNHYLLHTKNPGRAANFFTDFPIDTELCATIESNRYYPEISAAPPPSERIEGLKRWHGPRMITIEPILDFDLERFTQMIRDCGEIKQVNIGADSGHNHLPEPSAAKVRELIAELKTFTKVYQKTNLGRLLNNAPL